jgi:uncharacterized protein
MYQHPGVYLEEIPSGSRPIESASTSTALIAGFAVKGPVSVPTFILSFDQYVNRFGGINDFHGRLASVGTEVDHMGHAVKAFFDNGGSKAYIVRLANPDAANTATLVTDGLVTAGAKLIVPLGAAPSLAPGSTTKFLQFNASSPGGWSNRLIVSAVETAPGIKRYNVTVGYPDRNGKPLPLEVYADATLDPDDAVDFVGVHVNGRSTLLVVEPKTLLSLLDSEKTPLMVGSLKSGDLASLASIATLNGTGFVVTLQGNVTKLVELTGLTPDSTIADIAAKIQASVRDGIVSVASPRKLFSCSVEAGRLVLRSGIPGATASVAADIHTTAANDCRAVLKLIVGAPPDGAQALTGEQAFLATFSSSSETTLTGGSDGSLPGQAEYDSPSLKAELRKIRDISVIILPGQAWGNAAANAIIDIYRGHAEAMKNRMLIIDPDVGLTFDSANSFTNEGFPTSTYTCTYYPWVEVANPHYHADLRPDRAKTVQIAPSGFAAGLWARTDSRRGVWKAPAGLQASVIGIARTIVRIGDDEQDQLNPVGVNCLRRIISDTVIWGTRTLATKADPEWRYVPVRRTAMMIEESIYQGIQWAVFEPNDHRLWGSLRLNIETFMNGLFRAGAFQGEKASDAYFVRCGLNDTMTQGDIDAGQVIVIVGFAPVKPAEFVIVRLQQIVGRQ